MGRQTVHFAMGMSGISGLIYLLALAVPFHKVYFYAAGLVEVAQMKVWSYKGSLDVHSSDMCEVVKRIYDGDTACHTPAGGTDLMDLQARFCAKTIDVTFKNACEGLSNAYILGVVVIILAILNLITQGVALWLLYVYMYTNPKKQYREVALILVAVGAFLVAMAIIGYYPLVSYNLSNITTIGGMSFVLGPSRGSGTYWGYWLMCCGILCQTVQIILYKFSKISDEKRLVELKMQEQFEAELAINELGYGGGGDMYSQQAPPSWGPNLGAPGSAYGNGQMQQPPGYGMQPQSGGYGYGQQQAPVQGYGQQAPQSGGYGYGQQQAPVQGYGQQPMPGYGGGYGY